LIEALYAHRPILTFDDTGAPAGLIENGYNGVKHPPDPRMLAWDMNRLATDHNLNQQFGKGAFATLAQHNISWSKVAEQLLS
jgi:glycosyltransferase involved in cell wall biosynthesis